MAEFLDIDVDSVIEALAADGCFTQMQVSRLLSRILSDLRTELA